MMLLFCVSYIWVQTHYWMFYICTNHEYHFHWFLLFYEVEWQNLKAIFMKLKSTKLLEMFVSADSRISSLTWFYHHCTLGLVVTMTAVKRCHRWLCKYLLLSIPAVSVLVVTFPEVENRDPFEILNEVIWQIFTIESLWYLMLNIEVIEPGLFMVIAKGASISRLTPYFIREDTLTYKELKISNEHTAN